MKCKTNTIPEKKKKILEGRRKKAKLVMVWQGNVLDDCVTLRQMTHLLKNNIILALAQHTHNALENNRKYLSASSPPDALLL